MEVYTIFYALPILAAIFYISLPMVFDIYTYDVFDSVSSALVTLFAWIAFLTSAFLLYKNYGFKKLFTLAFIALAVFGILLSLIIMAFGGAISQWYSLFFVLLYIEFVIYILLLLWGKNLFVKTQKLFLVVGFVLACLMGGYFGEHEYHRTIPRVVEQKENLSLYEPFKKESQIARLEGKATLQFTDNLPRLDTATAFYPIVAAFVEATYPNGEYALGEQEVLTNTTTRKAYNRLVDGEVDMIFALLPSKEQEDYAKEKGIELKLTPISKEAFIFFVNASNPVENLTSEQLRDIYSGKITNWQQVGGNDEELKAFQRPPNSGSQSALERFMKGLKIMPAPQEDVVMGMGAIIEQTSDYKNYKGALGYSFRYYATKMVVNNNIRLLNIDGIKPDVEAIKSNQYPLINEIYIVTTTDENPNVNKFIQWILSNEGQELVEKSGYVKIK